MNTNSTHNNIIRAGATNAAGVASSPTSTASPSEALVSRFYGVRFTPGVNSLLTAAERMRVFNLILELRFDDHKLKEHTVKTTTSPAWAAAVRTHYYDIDLPNGLTTRGKYNDPRLTLDKFVQQSTNLMSATSNNSEVAVGHLTSLMQSQFDDLITVREANHRADHAKWEEACQSELASFKDNNVFQLVP
jgi:hypothetical protein